MTPQIVQNDNFPETIPQKRAKRDILAMAIFGIIFLIAGCILTPHNIFLYIGSVLCAYLLCVFLEYCTRICFLIEEYHHLYSRYEGKIWGLLKATFNCNPFNRFFIIVASLTIVMQVIPVEHNNEIYPMLLSYAAMNLFSKIFSLDNSLLHSAKLIDELQGLDYGSGMAHSFFHGYLKLILPNTGDERKGLKEQMVDYESKQNIKFATKKLYILIPLSAYCPTSIEQRSKIQMEPSESLDWRRLDRAGVKQRQYHNSVYKIWVGEKYKRKPIYVCAEYASPLLTFYEVIHHKSQYSNVYFRHRNEIMTNFYMTLKYLLENDPTCDPLCELIYYKDIDNNGKILTMDELDVGKLLCDRILRSRIHT